MNNMPDKEFEILIFLRKHDKVAWVDVLNTFGDYPETHRILKAMCTLGVVKITSPVGSPPYCNLRLTDKGYQTVLREEQLRDQLANEMANENARQKADHRFQILNSLISALAGSALTLLIEHSPTILKAVYRLFLWLGNLF